MGTETPDPDPTTASAPGAAPSPPGPPAGTAGAAGTIVRLVSRAASNTVRLEVSYAGRLAPEALFADLTMIGWKPPAPAPPPRTAIDWSTPDPVTGERFTVHDWQVEGAVVEPPAGNGPRGAWTAQDRAAFLLSLEGVLRRHGVADPEDFGGVATGALPGAAASTTGPPPPPPTSGAAEPTLSRGLRRANRRATLPPPPAAPGSTGATAAVAPTAAGVPASLLALAGADPTLPVELRAPITPARVPAAEDALAALGCTPRFVDRERDVEQRYRGSTYQTTVTDIHVEVTVVAGAAPGVHTALAALGLEVAWTVQPGAAVAPAVATTPASPVDATADGAGTVGDGSADDPDDATLVVETHARVALIVDPSREDEVDATMVELGIRHHRSSPTVRKVVSSYRASSFERMVPAVLIEAWVPEVHARMVAGRLAGAAAIELDDAGRLRIDPPRRTAVAPQAAPAPVAETFAETVAEPGGAPSGSSGGSGDPTPTGAAPAASPAGAAAGGPVPVDGPTGTVADDVAEDAAGSHPSPLVDLDAPVDATTTELPTRANRAAGSTAGGRKAGVSSAQGSGDAMLTAR